MQIIQLISVSQTYFLIKLRTSNWSKKFLTKACSLWESALTYKKPEIWSISTSLLTNDFSIIKSKSSLFILTNSPRVWMEIV